MKAKSLLIAGAALAASLMTSKAQVYSQNIVGYINVPLNAGYNLVANQLDLDGTGTNNTLLTVLSTNLPNKSTVSAWNGAGFTTATYSSSGGWLGITPQVTAAMQPGSGFFLKVSAATNITLVGNVIVGTNTYPILAGYNIVSPSAPVAGTIDTTNGFTPNNKDSISVWNGSGFNTYTFSSTGGWLPSDPQIPVGSAVFLNSKANTNWTEVLNVQ